MPYLLRGTVCSWCNGSGQWKVGRVNCKLSALQEVAEMLDAEVDGQELAVKSMLLELSMR